MRWTPIGKVHRELSLMGGASLVKRGNDSSLSSRRKKYVIADNNSHSLLPAALGEEIEHGKKGGMEKKCF